MQSALSKPIKQRKNGRPFVVGDKIVERFTGRELIVSWICKGGYPRQEQVFSAEGDGCSSGIRDGLLYVLAEEVRA